MMDSTATHNTLTKNCFLISRFCWKTKIPFWIFICFERKVSTYKKYLVTSNKRYNFHKTIILELIKELRTTQFKIRRETNQKLQDKSWIYFLHRLVCVIHIYHMEKYWKTVQHLHKFSKRKRFVEGLYLVERKQSFSSNCRSAIIACTVTESIIWKSFC